MIRPRFVVVLLVTLGLLQLAARESVGEPFPAVFQPSFAGQPASPDVASDRYRELQIGAAQTVLVKMQDDFWASKQGQKLLKERVERSFPEFISRAPSKFLKEVGIKRHYKDPEPLKQLRREPAR